MDTTIAYTGAQSIPVYISKPSTSGKHPALIVIHEIWGLNDQIRGVADRFAKQGYISLAPDLFASTPIESVANPQLFAQMQNPDTRDEAQVKMRQALTPMQSEDFAADMINKLQACFNHLRTEQDSNGNVGVLGFCFGGTYSFALAVAQPQLKAAVSFYGHAPKPIEKIANILCPILAFYGENDKNLMEELPVVETEMKRFNKQFEAVVYPNAGHAFFNEQNKNMYRKEAAEDAWHKTLEFLKRYL